MMRMLGKLQCFPTYYFNKKKRFSLLSSSRIIIAQSQKTALSLSSLIQLSSFLNHKEDADKREKEDGERERERRVYGRKKKIDRQNRKKMETRERGREDGKKKNLRENRKREKKKVRRKRKKKKKKRRKVCNEIKKKRKKKKKTKVKDKRNIILIYRER
jgi:hypothetical protein